MGIRQTVRLTQRGNLFGRIRRAEQAAHPTGDCPHQKIRVVYGRIEGEADFRPDMPEEPPCWCGRPRQTIQVIYADEWRGPLPEGAQQLHWGDDSAF